MGYAAETKDEMDLTVTPQQVTFAEDEGIYDVYIDNIGAVSILVDGTIEVEAGESCIIGPYHHAHAPTLATASSTTDDVPVQPLRDRDGSSDGQFRKLTLTGGSAAPPEAHASTHEDGGADEIDVTDLSGLLADAQTPLAHDLDGSAHNVGTNDTVLGTESAALVEVPFSVAAAADALLRRDANQHAQFRIITGTADPPTAVELVAGNLPAGGIGIAVGTTNAYLVIGEGSNQWQVAMTQAV